MSGNSLQQARPVSPRTDQPMTDVQISTAELRREIAALRKTVVSVAVIAGAAVAVGIFSWLHTAGQLTAIERALTVLTPLP